MQINEKQFTLIFEWFFLDCIFFTQSVNHVKLIHIINNTSLELEDRGLVAIFGQSGSGKTTLLNVIGGLDKINKGKIYINGKKISKRRANTVDKIRNLNIGYIFQDYKLIENMSVFDNVAISLRMIGLKNKKEIQKRVNYVLEAVNMYRYRNRPARNVIWRRETKSSNSKSYC